jgi:hypothetical protein
MTLSMDATNLCHLPSTMVAVTLITSSGVTSSIGAVNLCHSLLPTLVLVFSGTLITFSNVTPSSSAVSFGMTTPFFANTAQQDIG